MNSGLPAPITRRRGRPATGKGERIPQQFLEAVKKILGY